MKRCYKINENSYVEIPEDGFLWEYGVDEATAELIDRMPDDFEHWDGSKFVKDDARQAEALENMRLHSLSLAERQAEAVAKAEEKLLDKLLKAKVINKATFDIIKADKT